MAFTTKIISVFVVFSIFIGQIIRINYHGLSFPLVDFSLILFSILNTINHLKQKTLKVKNKYFLYFLIFSWVFLAFNLIRYGFDPIKPIFYLGRLTCLLSLLIFPPILEKSIKKFFILGIIANILFGFVQYFLWPNFTYFDASNWDPHLYRLVSTFFDPTFTALIYLFFIIKVFLDKKIPYRWPLLIISYVAMVLTYSRSTFMSFILAFTFISIKIKKPKIFLFSFILMISTIFLLPRQPGEGTKLERSSSIKAKIENYQEAINVFKKSPIIGIGYNNIGFIKIVNNPNSHANFGFDGSLMTILVTTGVIGFVLFLLGLKTFYLQQDLFKKTLLISLLFHSIFANSLLYPFVLLSLIFL